MTTLPSYKYVHKLFLEQVPTSPTCVTLVIRRVTLTSVPPFRVESLMEIRQYLLIMASLREQDELELLKDRRWGWLH